jgi:hypothetical protein
LKIYPNPATGGLLNIELSNMSVTSIISIFDINGKLLREQKVKDQLKTSIEVNYLPGIYLVNVASGQQKTSGKLFIN